MKNSYIKGVFLTILAIVLVGCGEKQEEAVLTQAMNPVFIAEGVREVSITKQDKEIMHMVYEPQEYDAAFEYWKMKVPYGDEVVVDTEEALKIYQQLVMMDMQMIPAPDGAKVNFKDPLGKIKINFCQTTENERAAASAGQETDKEASSSYKISPDSTTTLLVGDNDGKGNYYVAYEGDEENVAILSEEMVDVVLDIKPFDYILKISAVADRETMKSVTIKMEGKTYKLSEKQLDEQIYRTLYNDLFSVYIAEEITDTSKVGKEAILEIEFKRNVKQAQDLHIAYYPWDKERYAVAVNDETHFLVSSKDVDELKAKIGEVFAK